MKLSEQRRIPRRRQMVVGFAALIALIAVVGSGVYFSSVYFEEDNPYVNELSTEEFIRAEETRQASFNFIDDEAIMISHVNTSALTNEALSQWWEWYVKMLPPGFTTIDDLSDVEGLESITLAVTPTRDEEYAAGNPLYYQVLFTTEAVKEMDLMKSLQDVQDNSESNSFLTLNGEVNDRAVVALTSIHGLTDAEEIASDSERSFEPNSDWFPVDAEPTMYVNASGYFESMLGEGINDDAFTEESRQLMSAAFGFTDESGFTWLGRSSDFGYTWVSDDVSDIDSIDPNRVSYDELLAMQSETIGKVMEESELLADDTGDIEFGFGVADSMGMLEVLEAFSLTTANGETIGSVLDPYSTGEERGIAPQVSEGASFSVVFSPIMWQSSFQGMINPSHVKYVTAEVQQDGSSSLAFTFYEPGDEGFIE